MSDIDRLLNIVVLTDDDVNPANSISISATQPPDEHGGVPLVTTPSANFTPRTQANREFLTRKAVDILRGAGATTVVRAKAPPSLIHMHSTMRMGSSASNSVLDNNAESRAVKGLFIADNSALANAIGGPNPTLTTQALATRTAEKIFRLYFDGEPWVSHELPCTSVDVKVTAACVKRGL
jgi:choline dehydrogenase-like flavoprotein